MSVKVGMKQSNNVKIAITGGIGSGKSSVSDIVANCGYKVLSCDKIYSELLSQGVFNSALTDAFGNILLKDGSLDRKKLSAIVFSDSSALKKLNEITHPCIIQTALGAMNKIGLNFCEVPLLFENGFERFFDVVIVILRGANERITAITKRDGINEEEAKKRIKQQFDYDNSGFAQYYVLHNYGDLADLKSKTLEILEKIEKKYFQKK